MHRRPRAGPENAQPCPLDSWVRSPCRHEAGAQTGDQWVVSAASAGRNRSTGGAVLFHTVCAAPASPCVTRVAGGGRPVTTLCAARNGNRQVVLTHQRFPLDTGLSGASRVTTLSAVPIRSAGVSRGCAGPFSLTC